MLLRRDGDDVIAIPQPAHACISGQLARAWGNERFAPPAPWEDVCLAAEQHDIGWLGWELGPDLDEASGRPQEFTKVPTETHVSLWRDGVDRSMAYGRYPALLVSLHAETIYSQYFNFERASPEAAALVRAFLDEQHRLRQEITAALHHHPRLASLSTAEVLETNRLLIAALDRLSLMICWGVTEPSAIPDVPRSTGEHVALTVSPSRGAQNEIHVHPWPFASGSVEVGTEGRRLSGRYSSAGEMRLALRRAESVPVTAVLRPA